MKKVVFYLNQFFGQIGGEDKADYPPHLEAKAVGAAAAFSKQLKSAEVTHTLICGDNYYNENKDAANDFIRSALEEIRPDLLIAGPAFNAGRYGMACAGVTELAHKLSIPAISGMYEENPGVEMARKYCLIVATADSSSHMREALKDLAALAQKVLDGEDISPERDGYLAQGYRRTEFSDKIGAERAVDMLLARLQNKPFVTELPMPKFDAVEPAPAISDLSTATIALITTGGIVPLGNPDKLQSASAQKWLKYDVDKLDQLQGTYCTIHGGYDPVYANEKPDRVAPLDLLRHLEKTGVIGKVYPYFYTTTGTGTAVANSVTFGQEIGQELKNAEVSGAILTST